MTVAAVATVAATGTNGGFLRVCANCRTAVARKAATVVATTANRTMRLIDQITENGGFLRVAVHTGSGLTRGRGRVRAPLRLTLRGL